MELYKSETTFSFSAHEFTIFSLIIFAAKSFLLIRMPYRGIELNALYTMIILSSFYFYLRFRQSIISPPILLIFLATAIGADVIGNYLQLYGKPFGPVMYDEFTHFIGPALSLPATMWAIRESLKKAEIKIPYSLLSVFSGALTFAFSAYYEILELWDEKFFGGKRLWNPTDSANDLQYGLFGIIISTIITNAIFKIIDRRTIKL
jgi:multidrug transporter EmrE-like cation transporter